MWLQDQSNIEGSVEMEKEVSRKSYTFHINLSLWQKNEIWVNVFDDVQIEE